MHWGFLPARSTFLGLLPSIQKLCIFSWVWTSPCMRPMGWVRPQAHTACLGLPFTGSTGNFAFFYYYFFYMISFILSMKRVFTKVSIDITAYCIFFLSTLPLCCDFGSQNNFQVRIWTRWLHSTAQQEHWNWATALKLNTMTTSDINPSPRPGEECKTSKPKMALCLKIQVGKSSKHRPRHAARKCLDTLTNLPQWRSILWLSHSSNTVIFSGIWHVGQLISIMFDVSVILVGFFCFSLVAVVNQHLDAEWNWWTKIQKAMEKSVSGEGLFSWVI